MYEYDAATGLLNRSYWGKSGLHQERYDELNKLVPESGESDNRWVELLRCMGNVYYDCYNNGGCNLDVRSDQLDTIIDCPELLDRVESSMWEKFKSTIVAHRDQLENPEGRDEWQDCDDCNGSGHEDCDCNGGYNECSECAGTGEIECEECSGDGCEECDGTGEIICDGCSGDGEIECSNCGGDGGHDEWVEESTSYLRDSVGQDTWMGPLEAVTDAVIELCYERLNNAT